MLVAVGFLQNAALLVSMVIIGVRFLVVSQPRTYTRLLINGLLIGAICVLLKYTGINSADGVSIDTRSVFIFISAVFFGWIPTTIGLLVILVHRLFDAHNQMPFGTMALLLLTAETAGYWWYHVARERLQSIMWWQLLLSCFALHVVMVVTYLLTMGSSVVGFMEANAISLMVFSPIVAALCGEVITSYIKGNLIERKLVEQESYFHQIYNHVKVGIFHATMQGRYLDMNQAMADLVGFSSPNEAVHELADVTPSVSFVQELLGILTRDGEVRDYQCSYTNPKDEEKTVSVTAWVLPQPKSGQQVFEGVAVDITEQIDVQRRLQASEAKYRSYVEHSPLGVFVTNRNLQYVEVNAAACRMTGYSEQELLNMTVWQIFHPDDINIALKCKEQLISHGTSSAVIRCIVKSGDIKDCQVDTVMMGQDRILGLVTDVSDVVKVKRDLEAQRQMTINLVDTAKSGYWDWNMVDQTVFFSPGLKAMLGYDSADLLEGAGLWELVQFEEDKADDDDALNRHINSHGAEPYHYSMRLKHKDGHAIWCINYGYVIEWLDEEKPRRMVGSIVDVSTMKAAEDEVIRLNEQLEGRLSAITEPDRDTSSLVFTDLFDIDEIQAIQDTFAKTSNVASVIVDVEGYRITRPSNYCALCADVIRGTEVGKADCICMGDEMSSTPRNSPFITLCKNGCMLEGCISIMVEDRHIASWLYGQVIDSESDTDQLLQYAEKIGADEFQFVQALPLVPRMTRAQFESVGQALQAVADQLSRQAVQNAQQALYISERRSIERALRLSDQRYQQLFNEMVDGFMVGDVILDESGKPIDFRCISMNRHSELMMGLRADEVIGKTALEIFPQTEPAWIHRFCQVGITGEPTEFDDYFATSGCYYQVHVYRPEPMRFAVLFSDITSRVLAEQERKQLQQRIEQSQKLEGLGVLAGGIAHDFNNILMAIMGYTDIALLDVGAGSPAGHSLEEIKVASSRAAELCRQMLTYSGRATFTIHPINMHSLVMELVELSRASVSKKIKFHLHIPGDIPPIMGDDVQVRQIVMNLIVNASEAIGDRNGTISLTAKRQTCSDADLAATVISDGLEPGDYLVFGVTDNGCGMDDQTIARLFEPFYTTKFTGRGLGMSSVLGIIKGHKGTITVQSEVGKGTTIEVYLPLAITRLQSNPTEPATMANWRGEGTVLLVDDEDAIRDVGRQLLSFIGFNVLTASDGREALEVYRSFQQQITLVLLDMTMPDLDGVDTFRALRRIDPNVKVVISSGYTEKDIEHKFADEHVNGFIAKPYTLAMLRDQLYQYVHK